MPLPDFTNEAAFRTQWVGPFLSKLGYVQVTHVHGSGEQGKDFFFADYDQFEHRRFYAAQVKLGKIGAGQKELDDLLNQVRRCFSVRLRFHKEADERRISAVYVMASGSISKEAREYISDACNAQPFGENVYYLDGDTLDRLDKHAFQRSDRTVRALLIGFLHEADYNVRMLTLIVERFKNKRILFGKCRHSALDALLAAPPTDFIDVTTLDGIWHYLTYINSTLDYHSAMNDKGWADRLDATTKALQQSAALHTATIAAIRQLDSKYAISVEVLE
jgi:hypothetical protein